MFSCEYGESFTTSVPATGHSYAGRAVSPTCTSEGYTEYMCETCGIIYMDEYNSKLEHKYNEIILNEPDCAHDGIIKYECKCGASYSKSVSATGHDYKVTVVPAVCDKAGYTEHICTNCHDEYKDNFIKATNHKFLCVIDGWKCEICDEHICGDINSDGKVSAVDIVCFIKHLANYTSFTDTQRKNADINKDGTVNIFDFMRFKKYFLNYSAK